MLTLRRVSAHRPCWPKPKYFGTAEASLLISDQFSCLNAITVPVTLRESLVLLAVVLEQQTEL
jgi:hypothetical protein